MILHLAFDGENDLKSIGNVRGKAPGPRVISLQGHVETLNLILKMYSLRESGSNLPTCNEVINTMGFLGSEIEEGKISARSGLGFAILSAGILNACRWDKEDADVVVQKIYTKESRLWMPQRLETVGSFCSGEKRVYDFENELWRRYIKSDRREKNKLNYLCKFLEGSFG